MKVGPVQLGNLEQWGIWGAVTGAVTVFVSGAAGATVGLPLLAYMGYKSAKRGAAMFLLPATLAAPRPVVTIAPRRPAAPALAAKPMTPKMTFEQPYVGATADNTGDPTDDGNQGESDV
jgi:hypothetical protein